MSLGNDIILKVVAVDLGAFLRDTILNRHWIAGLLIAILVWIAISCVAFYNVEKTMQESLSFDEAVYFTTLNVISGEFPNNMTVKTLTGQVLTVLNAIAGLILLGCLIAVVTLALQNGDTSPTTPAEANGASPAASMLIGSEASKIYQEFSSSACEAIAAEDRRYFPDEETAQAAGFRRAPPSRPPAQAKEESPGDKKSS